MPGRDGTERDGSLPLSEPEINKYRRRCGSCMWFCSSSSKPRSSFVSTAMILSMKRVADDSRLSAAAAARGLPIKIRIPLHLAKNQREWCFGIIYLTIWQTINHQIPSATTSRGSSEVAWQTERQTVCVSGWLGFEFRQEFLSIDHLIRGWLPHGMDAMRVEEEEDRRMNGCSKYLLAHPFDMCCGNIQWHLARITPKQQQVITSELWGHFYATFSSSRLQV